MTAQYLQQSTIIGLSKLHSARRFRETGTKHSQSSQPANDGGWDLGLAINLRRIDLIHAVRA